MGCSAWLLALGKLLNFCAGSDMQLLPIPDDDSSDERLLNAVRVGFIFLNSNSTFLSLSSVF